MAFEHLTPWEAANLTPEQAEREEAALKREAAQEQALVERFQELTAKVQENTRRVERILADFGPQERPDLRLVAEEASDDV
jgi:hypothetical protein